MNPHMMKPTFCPGQHGEALHSALWLPARAKKKKFIIRVRLHTIYITCK